MELPDAYPIQVCVSRNTQQIVEIDVVEADLLHESAQRLIGLMQQDWTEQ